MPTSIDLGALYHQMAVTAMADGVLPDLNPEPEYASMGDWAKRNCNGPLANWVRHNVRYRPENEFFIVWGVACAIGNILQQTQRNDHPGKNPRVDNLTI